MNYLKAALLFCLATPCLFANISNKEKAALLALYEATNGSNWTNSWNLNDLVHT